MEGKMVRNHLLKTFLQSSDGRAIQQYGIIFGIVSAVSFVAVQFMGHNIASMFNSVVSHLN